MIIFFGVSPILGMLFVPFVFIKSALNGDEEEFRAYRETEFLSPDLRSFFRDEVEWLQASGDY
jgi:hypothetical protein